MSFGLYQNRSTRKIFFIVFIFICAIFISQPAPAELVSTLEKLDSMYEVDKCIKCHDDVAPLWENSLHSKPLLNPNVLSSIASDIGGTMNAQKREVIRECFSCHAPQIINASDKLVDTIAHLITSSTGMNDSASSEYLSKKLFDLNINCRICHMMKGKPEAAREANIIYGPGWDEHEHSHKEDFDFDTLQSDFLMSPDFCKSCHGRCSSHDPIEERVKCGKKSSANSENKVCLDCHMIMNHSFKGNRE